MNDEMGELVSSMDEDRLVEMITEQLDRPCDHSVAIGDDCAVLPNGSLFKTDSIVEGRHYLPETPAGLVGRKAVARVISDFAAMGGYPKHFLVTVGIRSDFKKSYIKELYGGMNALCREYNAYIMGGETVSVPLEAPAFFTISGVGETYVERAVLRSGAQIGDLICVTGKLGGSFESKRHLTFEPRVEEARWIVERLSPTAMMDLSDGLSRDLPRLAKASKQGYICDFKAVPRNAGVSLEGALSDGEDYELLFTVPRSKIQELQAAPCEISVIGEISVDTPTPLCGGWDHLAGAD